MGFAVYLCATIFVLASLLAPAIPSFLYGQPCSEKNTAYLYVSTWRLPGTQGSNQVNCVDISGIAKALTGNPRPLNYTRFFKLVASADTLYADHMNLRRFPVQIVNSLPNLVTIDMSGNNITNVPTKMHRIAPKLTKLLLSSNRIVVPKKKPLMVSKTLRTLMLSDNGIRNVYKFTFARLPALEVLYLDSNEMKFVTPAMFSPVKNLKYLHLGQNYLVKVPPKSAMPKSIVYYITKGQRKIKRDLRRKSRKNHKRLV